MIFGLLLVFKSYWQFLNAFVSYLNLCRKFICFFDDILAKLKTKSSRLWFNEIVTFSQSERNQRAYLNSIREKCVTMRIFEGWKCKIFEPRLGKCMFLFLRKPSSEYHEP